MSKLDEKPKPPRARLIKQSCLFQFLMTLLVGSMIIVVGIAIGYNLMRWVQ